MNTTPDSNNLFKELGFDNLPESDQVAFARDIGEVVFEAALLRFAAGLSESQASAFDHYLETEPTVEELAAHLETNHPEFNQYLLEEAQGFREEARAVLGAPQAG